MSLPLTHEEAHLTAAIVCTMAEAQGCDCECEIRVDRFSGRVDVLHDDDCGLFDGIDP